MKDIYPLLERIAKALESIAKNGIKVKKEVVLHVSKDEEGGKSDGTTEN